MSPFLAILRQVVLLLCCTAVAGQSYYLRSYQGTDGLSSNTITGITQDKKGFMWFGTRNGLNRFDGVSFKLFRNEPTDSSSIGNNYIRSLYTDSLGQLWVGTQKGLYIYNSRLENFSLYKGVPLVEINHIGPGTSNTVLIVADHSLYRYSLRDGQAAIVTANPGRVNNVSAVIGDNVWVVAERDRIEQLDLVTNRLTTYDLRKLYHKDDLGIQCILAVDDSSLLIGSMNGAFIFHPKTGDLVPLEKTILPNPLVVHTILKQPSGEYWLGTETGIYILSRDVQAMMRLQKENGNPYSLTSNVIHVFYKDREGGTWIGTFSGGISYYSSQGSRFRKYFPYNSMDRINGELVHEICEDAQGNIWIGTEDAGLNKIENKTGYIRHFEPSQNPGSIANTNLHGMLAIGNELWIGTYDHGLDVMNIETGKVIRHYKTGDIPGATIVCISKTATDSILLGTWDGLFWYNRKEDNFTRDPYFTQGIQSIHEDNEGTLWIATIGNGVLYYNRRTGKKGALKMDRRDPNSLPNDYVNNVYEDSHRNIWICTEAGLCKYDYAKKAIERFTSESGLPDNQTFKTLEDNAGNIWVSTSQGLLCLNPISKKFISYHSVNGLLSDQFNYNSALKSRSGIMYFGTVKGMVSFDPETFTKNNFVPAVYITGLAVNNNEVQIAKPGSPLQQSVSYVSSIALSYDESSVSIAVAALSYVNPELNEYMYKMEGFDENWTTLKSNQRVYYSKLPPGSYVFKVKGSNNEGVWNKDETTLAIKVSSPIWASTLAYCMYVLILAGIIFTVARYYYIALHEKNRRRLEAFQIEKEREIYNAKVEFFTNIAHEIRTPLTLIKLPLDKMKSNEFDPSKLNESLTMIEKNTNRLIDLTNQLLDFRNAEANKFSLSFVETNITELLSGIFDDMKPVAEQKTLGYRLEMPRVAVYAYVDTEALKKIIANLLNNAVKYAATTVLAKLLPFNSEDHVFNIEIKNDGYLIPYEFKEKIFEPFYRLKETAQQPGTGIGLALSRSLAESHKGVLDLLQNQEKLNVFRLTLPFHQENEIDLQHSTEARDKTNVSFNGGKIHDPALTTILLVEDNNEILQFLCEELSPLYNILIASEGKQALNILLEHSVQLIITDIMMPVMDGIELCRQVKIDTRHSHIPIVMLTAKNTLHAKIEGLEVGADAYIEKPFAMEHIKAQIVNLLANRAIIKDYFARSPLAHLKGIANNKTDSDFLDRLEKAILDNITDMNLDVESLSRIMNMSRPTLYRKIKDVSDLTPNELINLSRLKKAAELLSEDKYKMNEVASMLGYLPSNFSRAFYGQFGVTPSAYIQSLKKNI